MTPTHYCRTLSRTGCVTLLRLLAPEGNRAKVQWPDGSVSTVRMDSLRPLDRTPPSPGEVARLKQSAL